MTTRDVYLISPELSLVAVALLVMMLDLVVRRRKGLLLNLVSALGVALPFALTIVLWSDLHASGQAQMVGLFNTLVVDRFALFFKFLVLGIVALVVMASVDYVKRMEQHQGEFYALILLASAGMMLLAATRELISIYVALEMTALPLAALAAFLRDSRSTEAGLKFLILSAISSGILLYGMALVYGFTGTTYLSEIAGVISRPEAGAPPFGSYALLLGIVLIVAGFGFKIASVPFQMWVPDVYEGAPTPVTAYLSVASKGAGFAVLLRVFYTAFPEVSVNWETLFAGLAVASMFIGNLVAIAQSNIKRLLGYSTISHAGYLLVGLAAIAGDSQQGVSGPGSVLFYLGAYSATNLAAFFAIIAISRHTGSDQIDDLAGMGRRSPVLAFVLALAMVSLIGIPPTAVFVGKLYIFAAAVKADLVWLAAIGVVNSVISAYYYLRVVKVMYLQPSPSQEPVRSSEVFQVALAITAVAVLVLGILPGPVLDAAQNAARTLLP